MIFFLILVPVICILWFYWLWKRRKYYKLASTLPGPIGLPLLGIEPNILLTNDILQSLHTYVDRFGTFYCSWLGTMPVITVSEPSLAQDILTSPHCRNKSHIYKNAVNALGENVSNLPDPAWSFHRKHMNPAFGPKAVLSLLPIFNEEVNNLIRTIEKWADKNVGVDLTHTIQEFSLNVATRTALGKSAAQDAEETKRNVLESVHCVSMIVTKMIFNPLLAFRFIRILLKIDKPYEKAKRDLIQFVRELVAKKLGNNNIPDTQSPGENQQLFIDTAIELMKSGIFSPKQVEDESIIIVFAAFETTANAVHYALILMAMFSDCQQKLYEEVFSIFPEGGNIDVSNCNIKDLVYLDMFLNESMRVLTPVPMIGRETSSDVKLSNGVVIPGGVQINIFIHGIHRSKAIWGPDANNFNPDHFLPSNMEDKHPYSFLPLSKGSRNCIGRRHGLMSTKITLAKLVRNFKFTTDFQFSDLELVENVTLRLKNVPLLKIERRKE